MLVSTKGRYSVRVMLDLAEHTDSGEYRKRHPVRIIRWAGCF